MELCSVCRNNTAFKIILKTNSIQSDEYFAIGECPNCKVQKVINAPEDINKYYKKTRMKKRLNNIHSSLKKILLKKELNRILKSSDHNNIFVDIGCGVGDFTSLIHDQGLEVVAIDADPNRPVNIESIKDIPYYTIDYSSLDIDNFKLKKRGTAILRHVLEHTRDPAKFIQRLISSGISEFYIVVPNHDCSEAKLFGQYYYFLDPPLHLWFFSQNSLRQLLSSNNLKIVDSGFYTIPNIISSLYRFLLIKGWSKKICDIFRPQSIINSLSAPLDIILPNNVIWVYAKK